MTLHQFMLKAWTLHGDLFVESNSANFTALDHRSFAFVSPQVSAVGAFAQILRRYTSLNHLAQAARAVLQNGAQINQMLADINKVDFSNVQV